MVSPGERLGEAPNLLGPERFFGEVPLSSEGLLAPGVLGDANARVQGLEVS